MKTFKTYLLELFNPNYGKLQPHDIAKISEDDKFISHFRSNGVLSRLESQTPPNEAKTLQELNQLKSIMVNATDEMLRFALNAEVDESSMYQKFIMNDLKVHISNDFTSKILDQVEPILMYLKKYFNRARPEQFASANNIPFQVSITHTALHPAYPSGHALDSFIVEYVMKQLAPTKIQEIENFCRQMRESRLNVGLHYPSDNEISKKLANEIIKSGLLKIPSVIRESTEKLRKERFERIRQGLGPRYIEDSQYLQIGHDAFEHESLSKKASDKVNELLKSVYGIHLGEAPKPELWAAGHPTIKTEPSKGETHVSVRPSVINGKDITHDEAFPEIYKSNDDNRGYRIPHVYGRIDHVRKTISMSSLQPRMFSSSSLDRITRELKQRYPEYSIADLIGK